LGWDEIVQLVVDSLDLEESYNFELKLAAFDCLLDMLEEAIIELSAENEGVAKGLKPGQKPPSCLKKSQHDCNTLLNFHHALHKEVNNVIGPNEKQLKGLLKAHRIEQRPWHGGCVPGNEVHQLFSLGEQISQLFDEPIAGTIKQVFAIHKKAEALYAKTTFLTDEQQFELVQLLCELGSVIPLAVRRKPLPKHHTASIHMVQFLLIFHSIGLFTEQPGESIHWAFFKAWDLYRSYSNTGVRLEVAMRRFQTRNHHFFTQACASFEGEPG